MLGEDSRFQPRPLDAADREDLGVHGLPHAAGHLHPDQEAHLLSGEEKPELLWRALSNTAGGYTANPVLLLLAIWGR